LGHETPVDAQAPCHDLDEGEAAYDSIATSQLSCTRPHEADPTRAQGDNMTGTPDATEVSRAFIEQSRKLLTDSYLPRIEEAVEGLSPESVWWRANTQSNSIGNLLLHLDGNVRQWIISGLGGASDVRERQREFDTHHGMDAAELLRQLRATADAADRVLATIDPSTLLEPHHIQSYDVTVMRAIYTVVEHFSMHTGQIILLAKMFKGDLAFYDLSQGAPRPTWKRGVAGH
jgi:uncharacterized damage-inducible protein DinB